MTTATGALGIHGGTPVRSRPFPPPPALGPAEKAAVNEVMDSGVLSQFVGVWSDDFYGGPRVRSAERAWTERFGAKHAVTMNSATSALNAAATAAGVGPGDEVIVSPYTMSASAVCAPVNGAIPVFADIEPETFCLDPESVRSLINARTKAIVAVDLFGCPADFEPLMALAAEHGLVVIEDAAQAPGREPRRALGRHARAHRRLQPQLPQDDPLGRGRRRGHRRRPVRRAPGAGAQPRRGRRGRHGLRRLRHPRLQLPHG